MNPSNYQIAFKTADFNTYRTGASPRQIRRPMGHGAQFLIPSPLRLPPPDLIPLASPGSQRCPSSRHQVPQTEVTNMRHGSLVVCSSWRHQARRHVVPCGLSSKITPAALSSSRMRSASKKRLAALAAARADINASTAWSSGPV
jgi:hypothetical protein